ncbi:MAG: SpoIID/LytB domain-containing protein [Eubacteriales bacterium]
MSKRIYKIGVVTLGMLIVFFFIAKINGVKNGEVIEVNYVGDMERENEKQSVEEVEDGENISDSKEVEIENANIRVLIRDDNFIHNTHTEIILSAESGLQISSVDGIEICDSYTFTLEDEKLMGASIQISTLNQEEKIVVESLERSYGTPEYYGIFEIYKDGDSLILINEVELELYLRGVLPSEMPASYELEALKAQAVCARSYAYNHMETYNYPEYNAHIDDSTSYQVYNNLAENEACNQAIEDTKNEKVTVNGAVVTTYFFSTSCGYTTDIEAWGTETTEDNAYLQGVEVSDGKEDYEKDLAWYRWSVTLDESMMLEILEENLSTDFGDLESVKVVQRGTGNIALCLEVVGTKETVFVETENKIRTALGSTSYIIERQDGSEVQGSILLPSAFIELEYLSGQYLITGGGYGHGVGMSQNGANEMAKSGLNYKEILNKFYNGVEIVE